MTANPSYLRPTSVLPSRTDLTPRRCWLSGGFVLPSRPLRARMRARAQAHARTREVFGRTVGRWDGRTTGGEK